MDNLTGHQNLLWTRLKFPKLIMESKQTYIFILNIIMH